MTPLWNVALLSAPYSSLTYAVCPEFPIAVWTPGLRVLAPLGRGVRMGVLVDRCEVSPEGFTPREIVWPLERRALLSDEYMALIREFSVRQMESAGRILARVLPKGLRRSDVIFVDVDSGHRYGPADLLRMETNDRANLAQAWEEGRVGLHAASRAASVICRLAHDPPWPLRPGAHKQRAVLEYLYERGDRHRSDLVRDLGKGVAVPLKALHERGLVTLEEEQDGPLVLQEDPETFQTELLPLGPEQRAVVNTLTPLLKEDGARMALVHGVTGSGKTNVYLELIRQCLDMGRNALLLAPEVAIAVQLHRVVGERFPDWNVELYHGYQAAGQRQRVFEKVGTDSGPLVVIRTRLFFCPLSLRGSSFSTRRMTAPSIRTKGSFTRPRRSPFVGRPCPGGRLCWVRQLRM